jgi:signal transduction histidine kinase
MGRLFWKFFFVFLLAQLVTTLGVGLTIWALRPSYAPGFGPFFEHHHPPQRPGDFADRELPPPPPTTPLRPQGMRPPEARPHFLHGWMRSPLLPLAAGSVVSLLFAALLGWYFAKPIRSMRQAFDDVARGKLNTRLGPVMSERKDELADLGQDFDRMTDRLQALLDAQRRLMHDVSHEVRSPLARLQAAVDVMRQQPERAAELGERIERDTRRIDTLIGELLTLARLDAGMTARRDEEIDLAEILGLVAEDADFEAAGKGAAVDLQVTGTLPVRGNRDLLHRAVENVVRNALRHSPAGGRVRIAARQDERAGQIEVSVSDQGPGVRPENLAAIFAPFFRDSPANTPDGYGLGLAITQRVAALHGGEVHANNRAEGGLVVTLRLPRAG